MLSLIERSGWGNASSQRKKRAMSSVGVWEDLEQKEGSGILKVVIVSLLYFISWVLGLCNIFNIVSRVQLDKKEPLDSYLHLYCLWNCECGSIESKKTLTSRVSWEEHRIYPELDLGRRCRCNSGKLRRGQQAGKVWLGAHLDCITPIRFSIGGTDKEATEYGGSMSNQLTVFSRKAFVMVCKGWHLREAMWQQSREILQSFYNYQHIFLLELHIILISLLIYKPSTLIIFPWTFSTQLGASTLLFCLSQYVIPFYTLSSQTLVTLIVSITTLFSKMTSPRYSIYFQ